VELYLFQGKFRKADAMSPSFSLEGCTERSQALSMKPDSKERSVGKK
jgi:hypothetical protein